MILNDNISKAYSPKLTFQEKINSTMQTTIETMSDVVEKTQKVAMQFLINTDELHAKTAFLSGMVIITLNLIAAPTGISLFIGSCMCCVGLASLYLKAEAKLEELSIPVVNAYEASAPPLFATPESELSN